MSEYIEKRISTLVQSQFPAFYNEEGPIFIEFVKAYYEWMEEEGGSLYNTRRFFEMRDIDETLESFLFYFQKKYLYGIPFDVIINKRLLLKHVLDVYRSKGSLQCFKLLFKLIYNEDMELYLPGRDMLRLSDGTWKQPRYIEVSAAPLTSEMVGKTVKGISSGTTGIVESYITEPINQNIIGTLFISNILPTGGSFSIGEKIVRQSYLTDPDANLAEVYGDSPSVIGSLDSIEIENGGQDFRVGDIIKIAHRDPTTNEIISSGVEGTVKITSVATGRGQLNFTVPDGGFGYSTNNQTFVYSNDSTGQGGSFSVDTLSNLQEITYNTDILANYLTMNLDSTTYGFPGNASANILTPFEDFLSYSNAFFGSVATLTNIITGNSYVDIPSSFVRTSILSDPLTGTISYSPSSNVVTGTGTSFTHFFANNDTIVIQANTSLSNTIEHHVIRQVSNNTSLTLYGEPTKTSTASATFRAAPNPIASTYTSLEYEVIDANVYSIPFETSASVASTTEVVNSGKGYADGARVVLYRYDSLDDPVIIDGGTGYSNSDPLLFAGGDPDIYAKGTITTNGSGTITSVVVSPRGSGYKSIPNVYVRSSNGTGAAFSVSIREFNTVVGVSGRVVKGGVGKQRGYWSTTRGFFNSDKYIQDSYYYQDFSYQINTAVTLNKYRDILYNTFHIAGSELFGKFQLNTLESSEMSIGHESNVAITSI